MSEMLKPTAGFCQSWHPQPNARSVLMATSANSWKTKLNQSSLPSVGLFFSKYSVPKHKTKQDDSMQKQELQGSCEISWI